VPHHQKSLSPQVEAFLRCAYLFAWLVHFDWFLELPSQQKVLESQKITSILLLRLKHLLPFLSPVYTAAQASFEGISPVPQFLAANFFESAVQVNMRMKFSKTVCRVHGYQSFFRNIKAISLHKAVVHIYCMLFKFIRTTLTVTADCLLAQI